MKWIIRFTLPSGLQLAASGHKGRFAMVPIDPETGVVKNAHAWSSKHKAEEYWGEFLKGIGPIESRKIYRLKPEICQCLVAQ